MDIARECSAVVLLGNQAITNRLEINLLSSYPDGATAEGPLAAHDKGVYARKTVPGCWTRLVAREGPNRSLDSDRCRSVARHIANVLPGVASTAQ